MGSQRASTSKRLHVALVILLLLLAVLGGFGFAAHFLWIVLIVALVLWVVGFFVGGIESGGRRRCTDAR